MRTGDGNLTPREARKLALLAGAAIAFEHAERLRKRGKPGLARGLELRGLEALEASGLIDELGHKLAERDAAD